MSILFAPSGNIEPPRSIVNRLKFVLNDSASSSAAEFPLGVLTAEQRDTWADVREHLLQSHNEAALDTIDSALFVVSLDDNAEYSEKSITENPVPMVQNMLHGDKNGLNNRWFDKSLSLIVCKDGNAGINFEHSWGDGKPQIYSRKTIFSKKKFFKTIKIKYHLISTGVAVLRYFNEIYKETTTNPFCQPSDVKSSLIEDVGDDIFKIGTYQNGFVFSFFFITCFHHVFFIFMFRLFLFRLIRFQFG